MKALAVSMIVGGIAFLTSGLIFLLHKNRRLSEGENSLEQSLLEIAAHLEVMHRERGEL
jgi:hypothetical protein